MRKFLLASVAIAGLASSTFALNAFAASGDAPSGPDAAQIQRMQERHAVLLDAHLAAMKAGLKLTAEQEKNWPAFESGDPRRGKSARGSMASSARAYEPAANAPRRSSA